MPKVATKVKARAKAKRKGTINDWKERYKTSALQPFGGAKLLSYLGFPMGRYLSFPCGAGGSKSYKAWSSMNFSDSLCYKLEKVDTHLPHSTLPLDSWLFWAIWIFWIPTLFPCYPRGNHDQRDTHRQICPHGTHDPWWLRSWNMNFWCKRKDKWP